MDTLDWTILHLLQQDSRLSNKQIGLQVHLTGQAVGNRINRMVTEGTIQNFSIKINYPSTQFIRLFMNGTAFTTIEKIVRSNKEVERLYKISGQACYMVIAHFSTDELAIFIEEISLWARYTVETVIYER